MTTIRSTDEIYPILDKAFEGANKPLTVSDLMGFPDVFTASLERWGPDKVKAGEKLSNTLGFMWRRGALDRFPAPPSISMARYAYAKAGKLDAKGEVIKYEAPTTKNKGDMTIVEKDGEVVIEMANFTIVIKPK